MTRPARPSPTTPTFAAVARWSTLIVLGAFLWTGCAAASEARERGGWSALVVATPGVDAEAMAPLVRALRRRGADVRVHTPTCASGGLDAQADALVQAARAVGPRSVIVAHGLGATIALAAAPSLEVGGLALLAPVLDVWPVAAMRVVADLPLGERVDLGAPRRWGDHDLRATLVGQGVSLGCVDPALAAEVQGWIHAGAIPLPLDAVRAPVWLAVSPGDDLAAVEATIPASRRIATREVVRLGLGHLDHQDFTHAELLTHKVPARLAAKAARKLARSGP